MSAFVLAILLLNGKLISPDPEAVKDCQPCEFSPGDRLPLYAFTFEVKANADGERWLTAIDVRSLDKKVTQRLNVDEMMPQLPDQPFFFGHEDLNSDGLADLSLVTATGASNGYSQYWLFLSSTGTYKNLGKYPILKLDKKRHQLTSYETGGMAGLIYESIVYAFAGTDLVVTRSEKQDVIDESRHLFRREVRVRKGDKLVLVKSTMIRKQTFHKSY